jgi:NitT/TauT family transport system permease protein
MTFADSEVKSTPVSDSNVVRAAPLGRADKPRLYTLLSFPIAILLAYPVHLTLAEKQTVPESHFYSIFLGILLAFALIAIALQATLPVFRRWLLHMFPILAAGIGILAVGEIITSGLQWLPLPYFPSPPAILFSLIYDRAMIFDSTWHSLLLLLSGYILGTAIALVTGVCIGWFMKARYWGMPLLKIVGPIPATAWIPLAMVVSPSTKLSAVGLIALAVWFPVTMLTASGISNTRASYIDVARTLGASRTYLIFRVAIPAAMPNIFIGLFMGLGASFLTLVVAETVGVRSGLGWYLGWAQAWAEYGKVYAALVIMSAFFSSLMTLLFKLRDHVLIWQKGVIKW